MERDWRAFPELRTWEWVAFGAVIANFLAFLLISLWLGGTAWTGMIEKGKYYLGANGRFAEVSQGVYRYSEIHARLMVISMIGGLALLVAAKVRESLSSEDTPTD
jgi:hypothetical protein